jgi:tripartite-type tricarboxylate transporter receptor subunit TctC
VRRGLEKEETMSGRGAWKPQLAALIVAFAASTAAHAQNVVRIAVGGPPGGLFDIALRLVSERLERELGRDLVIDNKPGAGGAVALASIKSAKPDGLTLAMINVAAAANESIIKNRGYDLLADFEPVGLYAYPTNILIVNSELPAGSVTALVDALKARGATNYSSGGVGSPGHLAGEMFKARTGVAVTHVPYKGAPPAVLAVATGEVAFMFATASAATGQIKGGKVRALAVTTAERLPQFPDLPTMPQAGLADFNVSDWAGVVLPKGAPPAVRDRLHAAFAAAFADPEVRERLRNATFIPAAPPLGPAEFDAFIRAEVDKWGKVVSAAGISPQ